MLRHAARKKISVWMMLWISCLSGCVAPRFNNADRILETHRAAIAQSVKEVPGAKAAWRDALKTINALEQEVERK